MTTRDDVIATELATDPLTRNYVGLSDDGARDDINSEYRHFPQGVFLTDLYQYLIEQTFNPPQNLASDGAWPVLLLMQELRDFMQIQGQNKAADDSTILTINDQVAAKHMLSYFGVVTDTTSRTLRLDMSKGVNVQSWDQMVFVGCMNQTQRDAIDGVSDILQSRGTELTFDDPVNSSVGSVTTADITRNRV